MVTPEPSLVPITDSWLHQNSDLLAKTYRTTPGVHRDFLGLFLSEGDDCRYAIECGDEAAVIVNFADFATADPISPEAFHPFLEWEDWVSMEDSHRLAEILARHHPTWLRASDKVVANLSMFPSKGADFYQSRAKTKPTYLKGAAYQELEISYDKSNYGEAFALMLKADEKHPGLGPTLALDWRLGMPEFRELYMIRAHKKGSGDHVFSFLCFDMTDYVYGDTVLVSDDKAIQNRHKPYIVAHIEALKLGIHLQSQCVDFGFFFNFKDIFGIEPVYKSGVRFLEPERFQDSLNWITADDEGDQEQDDDGKAAD